MVPLTVRSHYSLMWGTASIQRICRRAKRLGYDRLALTDTDNLYGLWPFLTACRREGLTPIIGAELTEPGRRRRAVCLVETMTGYRNLCRLLSQRHLQEEFDLQQALGAHAGGLTVLTQNPQLLKAWHAQGMHVAATLPRRPLPPSHQLIRTAGKLGAQVVATPGSFFLAPAEHALHRLLRAIDGNTTLARLRSVQLAPSDAWLAAPAEYARRFAICPQAVQATMALAERLTFRGPRFGLVLPPWQSRSGQDARTALRTAAFAGAGQRYGTHLPEPVVERLEHELAVIGQMGFAGYFLVVRDIVRHSPRTCGRGSGAASLVAYCLRITNVCPIKHNLYFGRFLNPGRRDAPDIDVDFAWDERDAVLAQVLARYVGHAAMVSNHVCFKPRMAVREVAKVFGLTDREIGRVSKRLPWFWRPHRHPGDWLSQLAQLPETRTLPLAAPWPEILQLAQRINGLPRYLSVHAGGVVITPDPIDSYVPLQRAPKGVPVIQWEKEAAEEAGLVKIDLLGNRSLGVIRDAMAQLQQNGAGLDEASWEPEDDPATQRAVARGRTMGCFYIESPAMRLLQQKAGRGDFDHLVIHSSIIRPAANDYIREYVRRLRGGPWDPLHPLLGDVLAETYGVMVYQEDVSRAASALAGFSDAEADGLRKVLSKKDREHQLRDYRARFCAGARARGLSESQTTAVWDMMMSFEGYSFCKPHSASYARVSFQAAYLKVHHPAEFMAAVISNQGGYYSTFAYVSEARRLGLTILPPDVNCSQKRWTGRGRTLRVGLQAIKGLSVETQTRIVAKRRRQPYGTVADFLQRVRPDEAEARVLVQCGALDALAPGQSRAALMWTLACWQKRREAPRGLFSRFGANSPPQLPPDDLLTRLRREFAVLGFLCDRHPLTLYAHVIRKLQTLKAHSLPSRIGRQVRIAAWLVTGKVVHTKHGDPMEFLTFEDETGLFETTFFPEAYRRFCFMLDRQRPYLLQGTVAEDWGAVTLTVARAAPLPAAV